MRSVCLVVLVLGLGCQTIVYSGDGSPVVLEIVDLFGFVSAYSDDANLGINRAITMWNTATRTNFQREGRALQRLPVHIAPPSGGDCSEVVSGCYAPWTGAIWVTPEVASGGDLLAQTLAHELGHAIGLNHVPNGIMSTGPDLFNELQSNDLTEYAWRWR